VHSHVDQQGRTNLDDLELASRCTELHSPTAGDPPEFDCLLTCEGSSSLKGCLSGRERFLWSSAATWSRSPGSPIAQVAGDFGISESCLQRWLTLDDVEEGWTVAV
jgi:hypothetical protein